MSDYINKIKQSRRGDNLSKKDRDLLMAWVKSSVTIREVQMAKGYRSPSPVYCYLANGLKKIIRGAECHKDKNT